MVEPEQICPETKMGVEAQPSRNEVQVGIELIEHLNNNCDFAGVHGRLHNHA